MKRLASFICLICATSLSAALPPLYQNIRELKSILEDPRLDNALQSGDAILKIERNENGYLVITNHRQVQVDIKYHTGKIGPAEYTLDFIPNYTTRG